MTKNTRIEDLKARLALAEGQLAEANARAWDTTRKQSPSTAARVRSLESHIANLREEIALSEAEEAEEALPTVTAKESEMLKAIRENEYSTDGSRWGGCWAFVVCEDRSGSSVFGSLVKKGLATSEQADVGRDGRWLTLTDLGADVLDELLLLEGEGPVLEAPEEPGFVTRENDFSMVLVEEAPVDTAPGHKLGCVCIDCSHGRALRDDRDVDVVLEEALATVQETLFSEAGSFIVREAEGLRELSGRELRVIDNRKGRNGREAQAWQAEVDAKELEGILDDREPAVVLGADEIVKAAKETRVELAREVLASAVRRVDECVEAWDRASARVRAAQRALRDAEAE